MKRIGAITIGQSPRVDVVPEMQQILGPDVEIVQAGVLDGLSPEEIAALAPAGNGDSEIRRLRGSPVLVSRLRDGSGSHRYGHARPTPVQIPSPSAHGGRDEYNAAHF